MKRPLSPFWLLTPLLPLLAVAALTQRSLAAPDLPLSQPILNCTQPPTYRVGYELEAGGLRPEGGGFKFWGESRLDTDLCSAGVLLVTAEGQVAGGAPPRLDIALNSRSLASFTFGAPRTVRVPIPGPGRLTLGYFNDYYRSEARIASLENLRFRGRACRDLGVTVPPETGGSWNPSTRTAFLVTDVPMTLRPCAAGELTMRVLGRPGNGIFPILELEQGGRRLARVQTSGVRQPLRLDVAPGPLTIRLTNPYFKELADRNLMVRQLEFRPTPPTSP
ncbi:MAG: hypothetical protein AB1511_13235 [Deinococcota bacterium]